MYLSYSGVVEKTPELRLVLDGSPDAKTTEFGNACRCLLSRQTQIYPFPGLALNIICQPLSFQLRLYNLTVNLVIEMKFETGNEKLKDLELGVFVGAGRFVVEKGKPAVVEYKVSKIVKGN